MADTSQGEGWWQASDLKWYPPELHADATHRARYAVAEPEPAPAPVPPSPPAPPQADPVAPPPGVPPGPQFERIPLPADHGAPPAHQPSPVAATTRRGPLLAVAIGVALVGAAAAAIFLLSGSSDDEPSEAFVPTVAPAPTAEEPTPRPGAVPGVDVSSGTVGTVTDPAAFGEVYGWPQWRGSVVDVIDAVEAGLVAEFDDPPPDGRAHLVVIYDVTYVGGDLSAFEPFLLDAPEVTIEERFACVLDTEALAAIGATTGVYELAPAQTVRLAVCIEVAEADADGLLISLDNVNVFDEPIVFGAEGSALEPLDPPPFDADDRTFETVPYGTILDDEGWQGTVVEVFDAQEAGLVSEFAQPPTEGRVYVVVAYDVTNTSAEDADFIPVRITGLGTAVFESFNDCFLDVEASAERGLEINRFELAAGETVRLASCLDVPVDERGTFAVRIQNSFSVSGEFLLFPGQG